MKCRAYQPISLSRSQRGSLTELGFERKGGSHQPFKAPAEGARIAAEGLPVESVKGRAPAVYASAARTEEISGAVRRQPLRHAGLLMSFRSGQIRALTQSQQVNGVRQAVLGPLFQHSLGLRGMLLLRAEIGQQHHGSQLRLRKPLLYTAGQYRQARRAHAAHGGAGQHHANLLARIACLLQFPQKIAKITAGLVHLTARKAGQQGDRHVAAAMEAPAEIIRRCGVVKERTQQQLILRRGGHRLQRCGFFRQFARPEAAAQLRAEACRLPSPGPKAAQQIIIRTPVLQRSIRGIGVHQQDIHLSGSNHARQSTVSKGPGRLFARAAQRQDAALHTHTSFRIEKARRPN